MSSELSWPPLGEYKFVTERATQWRCMNKKLAFTLKNVKSLKKKKYFQKNKAHKDRKIEPSVIKGPF